ncbi:MAG: DUF4189 domain-containing protein [Rhodospirillaceae bacterium]|nr:DUF4189 domain-containing protein [Rhodospirillaceae bacterium]
MRYLRWAFVGLTALAGLGATSGAALADCQIGNCWGAVAYSERGDWAYAVNYPTRNFAGRAAQQRCHGRCTHVLTFANSCGAYASGPRGNFYYGWGNAPTRAAAEQRALYECRLRGPYCTVRVWGCTSR